MNRETTQPARRCAQGRSGRFVDLDFDKLRGGYYTPATLASWMAAWAVRKNSDTVLEPSCGDGAFLDAVAKRLTDLGASSADVARCLVGVEIVPAEAAAARNRISARLGRKADCVIQEEDFFGWWQREKRTSFDAIVGNPPFIRYQSCPEPFRARAMAIMESLELKPNRLTNIWVPFVAAAAASLRRGGRMALVLPAEILQVSYASQLRAFLTTHFFRIDVVACNELFFANAEQEVVLLLASDAAGEGTTVHDCRVSLVEAATVNEIIGQSSSRLLAKSEPKLIRHDSEKWLKYFLSAKEISLMRELRESGAVADLATHAAIDVGVVTGKNEFFVLSSAQVKEFGLNGHTVPVVSRSSQMRGAVITAADWRALASGSDRVHLLDLTPINGSAPKKSIAAYIRQGENSGFHNGYKCSIRTPWYAVPAIWVPDGLLFRQIYDFPRAVLNRAAATTTDTIHRMRSSVPAELLIRNVYTHLTGASAEIEGRSYGGGVLELEPTEAERLLVPATLHDGLPLAEIDRLVRAGRLDLVLDENDRRVLINGVGLARTECQDLRAIWSKMRDRRLERKRGRPAIIPMVSDG